MDGPQPTQQRNMDRLINLLDVGIVVSLQERITALDQEIHAQQTILRQVENLAGDYGQRYYREQATIYDNNAKVRLGDSMLSSNRLHALLGSVVEPKEMGMLRTVSQKLTKLARSIPSFYDSSPGYGICEVRDIAVPGVLSVYNGAEQWLAERVERADIMLGSKREKLRFYLPQDLLETLYDLSTTAGALDGLEYTAPPSQDYRDLRNGPIDELKGGKSAVNPLTELAGSQGASKIREIVTEFAAAFSKLGTEADQAEAKFLAARKSDRISFDNVYFSLVSSIRLSLSFLSLSASYKRPIDAVFAYQQQVMAEQLTTLLRGFREQTSLARERHESLLE